jgi:octaheme c-type cytochrome (tetrathionate reductase family)
LIISQVLLAGEDHSDKLTGPFSTPQEVTAACLECHEDAATEVMGTIHWKWETDPRPVHGHEGTFELGKKNVFNNFCIALESNWPRCTSCHVGFGWKDKSFDFTNQQNVDCLVCHEQTGTYRKSPAGAGMPEPGVNLLAVAQSVGVSKRENCGACHFFGGGGENVKHGDLDHGLINPDSTYDVHMGAGMVCQDCHKSESHKITGESTAILTDAQNRLNCSECHEGEIHKDARLNEHAVKIACQTCHIPEFAKGQPTKIYWDWSSAGQDKEVPKDEFGLPLYDKKKGDFVWAKNVKPELYWYNGKTSRYLKGDKLEPGKVLSLNLPLGEREDSETKLSPFKVMRGKQIYDTEFNYLIVPKVWGGYWKEFDWNKASVEGMQAAGLEYSGHFGWVETEMYWKVNHMVSPKEEALKCTDCHGKGEGKRVDWQKLGYKGDQQIKKNRD